MNAGDLRDRVTLYTLTTGASGVTQSLLREQWCALTPASGREIEVGTARGQSITARAVFRPLPVVGAEMILQTVDGRRFRIESVLTERTRQVAYLETLRG